MVIRMVIRMVSRMVIRMVSRMVILWLYGVLEGPQYTFNQNNQPIFLRSETHRKTHLFGGQLIRNSPVLPVCRPWFAQVRDKSFHTHKPVCPELVVFDMLHVTGVSADFSVFRKKSFMSQSVFLR